MLQAGLFLTVIPPFPSEFDLADYRDSPTLSCGVSRQVDNVDPRGDPHSGTVFFIPDRTMLTLWQPTLSENAEATTAQIEYRQLDV